MPAGKNSNISAPQSKFPAGSKMTTKHKFVKKTQKQILNQRPIVVDSLPKRNERVNNLPSSGVMHLGSR